MSRGPFDLIAFDLGNVLTIVDESQAAKVIAQKTGASEAAVKERVFGPYFKAPLETGRQTWEEFAEAAIRSLGPTISANELRDLYCSVLTPNTSLFPLVDNLAQRYRLALCSNTSPVHWELERKRISFARLLDPVVLSYKIGVMKPDRAIFETISNASKTPPHRILFIDDMAENVAGAREAGITALRFENVAKLQHDLINLGVI